MKLHFDLHSHSHFSADGISPPEEMIAVAKKKGLHGIAITDHNNCDAAAYLLERGLMRADGLPVDGFLILPGVEMTTAEGHLLCLGVTLPNMKGTPAVEMARHTRALGGLAVPPHPFDLFRAGIRQSVLDQMEIDALEAFNAASTLKRHNDQAYDYALRRQLPMTAGSDAHHASAVGTAYTILETDDFSVRGVLEAIRHGPERKERYLSNREKFKKTWANWLRLKRRSRKEPAE